MKVEKRDGTIQQYNFNKIENAISKVFSAIGEEVPEKLIEQLKEHFDNLVAKKADDFVMPIEDIQDTLRDFLIKKNKNKVEIIFSNDIEDDEVDVNQLFERFYRSPRSNKKEGSGIGLSIAKEIAELHKAKISASIKDNKIYFNIIF